METKDRGCTKNVTYKKLLAAADTHVEISKFPEICLKGWQGK